ncbi:MAG: STAS domain-containing protein [Anaerolineales bacterium]|nr:STAS domain-containing protein [Anaerolineales bacterium]MBX3036781.1 STAS domain-containing protein [Anaerolineales bacterium]
MLNIDVSKEKDVTLIKVSGELDGQSYQNLISKAQEIYNAGAKNIVLDLSELHYISSAGLVALHFMALLSKGEKLPDTEQGWSTLKSVDRTRESGVQKNVKLLNPRPEVLNVLEMVGFSTFFEIFTDKQKAIDSF